MKPNLILLVGSLLLLGACAAPLPTGQVNDAPSADEAVDLTLTNLRANQWVRKLIDESYGFAVFPGIGRGGAGIGAALGAGKVYEQGKLVGTAAATQITFGLQIGGQLCSGIVLFRDKAVLDAFKLGDFSITGQASAVFVFWGLSIDAVFADGVTMITQGPVGFMYDLSFGGMSFDFRAMEPAT